MGDPHRVGIVGLGNISAQYLATLAATPRSSSSRSPISTPTRRPRSRPTVPASGAERERLLAAPGRQTVLNLTIPAAHAEVALGAIGAGKHVYGEKPLAVTARRVDHRRPRGRRPGRMRAGHRARHRDPDGRAAIDDGQIGRPIAATAVMVTPGHEPWHPNPDFYYAPGGGPLLDMGPYYITALVTCSGRYVRSSVRPAACAPSADRPDRAPGERIPVEVDTHVTGVLEHDGGALSTIIMSFDSVAHDAAPIEVHGETGTLGVPDPKGSTARSALRARRHRMARSRTAGRLRRGFPGHRSDRPGQGRRSASPAR